MIATKTILSSDCSTVQKARRLWPQTYQHSSQPRCLLCLDPILSNSNCRSPQVCYNNMPSGTLSDQCNMPPSVWRCQQNLFCAFVLSRPDHCNSPFSGCPIYLLSELQKVQNNAARFIFPKSNNTVLCNLHLTMPAYVKKKKKKKKPHSYLA